MQGSDKAQTQEERDAQWVRRGKKYKTKYLTALKDLFKEVEHDTDCQVSGTALPKEDEIYESCCPNRKGRPREADSLVR